MAKAVGIDHLAVYVTDMEKAKAFFIDGLGLIPDADYGDEFFMNIGGQKIALFLGATAGQSLNHLGMEVDDFQSVVSRLEKLGYKMYKKDMVDRPDGLRIQLVP